MCSCTTACCGLLSHQSAKWRVLTRRCNSSQGPFQTEGKVIHSRAQVLVPTGLLWRGEGAARLVSVQELVTQGTPRTLLFVLA